MHAVNGTQFTNTSAVVGNDISTLPDFLEIRAPAGSLPGVSGFQLNFRVRTSKRRAISQRFSCHEPAH